MAIVLRHPLVLGKVANFMRKVGRCISSPRGKQVEGEQTDEAGRWPQW